QAAREGVPGHLPGVAPLPQLALAQLHRLPAGARQGRRRPAGQPPVRADLPARAARLAADVGAARAGFQPLPGQEGVTASALPSSASPAASNNDACFAPSWVLPSSGAGRPASTKSRSRAVARSSRRMPRSAAALVTLPSTTGSLRAP